MSARAEAIAGFREMADYLDAHPDVPIDRYALRIQVHVSQLDHMSGKDEPAILAELARIADALGVEADLRDEPGAPHPHAVKAFSGGVSYTAVYVTKAYYRGYAPDPQDIAHPGGVVVGPEATGPATTPEEVAGLAVGPGPATSGTHTQVAGWAGGPGGCGVECACGTTYDGFDTISEAEEQRARHAADDQDEDEAESARILAEERRHADRLDGDDGPEGFAW